MFALNRLVFVLAVVAALMGLFLFGLLRGQPNRDIASNLLGKSLDDWEAPVFERFVGEYGPTLRYSELLESGKPLVVNVWAEWCYPACWNEAPRLQAAWERYRGQINLVGVDFQDSEDKANEFMDRFGFTFPNVKDPRGNIGIAWGVFGVPETFFIRADGTLNYKHSGEISMETLEAQIQELLE